MTTVYAASVAEQRCPNCQARAAPGHVYCERHLARMRELAHKRQYAALRQAQHVAEGRCFTCGRVRDSVRGRSPRCADCRAQVNRSRRLAYAAARAAGLCVSCKRAPVVPHERFDLWCAHCLARYLAWEARKGRAS